MLRAVQDRPSRTVAIVGGAIVLCVWVGSGVLAWQGTWWPLIVVLCVAGSAGVFAIGIALFARPKSGRIGAAGRVAAEGPGPRAPAVRGSAAPAPGRGGKLRKNRKRKGKRR